MTQIPTVLMQHRKAIPIRSFTLLVSNYQIFVLWGCSDIFHAQFLDNVNSTLSNSFSFETILITVEVFIL